MKTLLNCLVALVVFALVNASQQAKAQTLSSKIMDATVEWSGGNGTLKVYLTDIDGLSGLQVGLGTEADTMNVYFVQNTITGNTFGSGGTVTDNVLMVPIGSFATGDYFARIRVLLSNNTYNEIEIASHN